MIAGKDSVIVALRPDGSVVHPNASAAETVDDVPVGMAICVGILVTHSDIRAARRCVIVVDEVLMHSHGRGGHNIDHNAVFWIIAGPLDF